MESKVAFCLSHFNIHFEVSWLIAFSVEWLEIVAVANFCVGNVNTIKALNEFIISHEENTILLLGTVSNMLDSVGIDLRPKVFIVLTALSLIFFISPRIAYFADAMNSSSNLNFVTR